MENRIRHRALVSRVISAEAAQAYIMDGMTVGVSGFTKSGDAKAVLRALAARVEQTGETLKINLFSGASLGATETLLAEHHLVDKRLPYQGDAVLRRGINAGAIKYIDQHLSHTAEYVRSGFLGNIDLAIVEAAAITEDGGIVPTTSVGNTATFVAEARHVIVELNLAIPASFEGLHDIYLPKRRPFREPLPITRVSDRIGTTYIPCDPDKIVGIVITEEYDTASKMEEPDADIRKIADYVIAFLAREVRAGRLPERLLPLQNGVGSVSNAVLSGLKHGPFENLEVYTEVMQDSLFELIDAGKVVSASTSSFALSEQMGRKVLAAIDFYRQFITMRPQEISNHPEVIRRLGVISMNTALEMDIYGNVNSTHVAGAKMMNGIGGSGDFARNAGITIFFTKSLAKEGRISSVVPFVSHVDHTEHDVDVLVTEQGIADLRGLAPRDRALVIIENLAHPAYRDALRDYYRRALVRGGQTPHLLEEALGWHRRLEQTGDMREAHRIVVAGVHR